MTLPALPAVSPLPLLPTLGQRTQIMGILNVTPDSFSDGGMFDAASPAFAHAQAMVAQGADIIDIGGESTRPGSTPVAETDEIARVVPIIEEMLIEKLPVPLSIDTYKAGTARAALAAGARMVNDVWGLQREPDIARVAADFGAPVVIMHNRAEIDAGIDIVADQIAWFERSLDIAAKAGIPGHHIILDPGIGFGKSLEQNLEALARLGELRRFGHPILLGTSRKSFIGRILNLPVDERLYGTLASNVAGILAGADILRVHDVRANFEAAGIADAVKRRGVSA
ncbi:MAG: dihydropteroate synthase [Hyphomicrobiaceae bacterium]|nr:dihydropteroate synthase [Hyphomicrobiaceae bacterium]